MSSPAAPGAGQNRYDLYIIRPRDPAVNGTYTQNDWILDVVPGTPSASPTPPTAASAPAGTVAVATCLVVGGQATLTPANLTDLRSVLTAPPTGQLAYAQVTAPQVLGTASGTNLTGLTLTLPVVGGQRLRITGSGMFTRAGNDPVTRLNLRLHDETNAVVQSRGIITQVYATAAANYSLTVEFRVSPAAGSHTYYLDASWDSGGTTTLNGGTGNPAFIAIDAC